ncbi:MAG: alpha/beta fold hydrolase [Actinomycetota bacterium]
MHRLIAAIVPLALLVPAPSAGAEPAHSARDHTVTNPNDGTRIAITVFKPGGAEASNAVPVVLHSHGWGGSRQRTIDGAVRRFLDAGFGVVSIDQRGHGESEGQAHVQDPTRETEDIKAVIDRVARFDWVLHDRDADGNTIAADPVLGAIGGSYGGGYQTMTALDEIADEGRTRFNALAPEITWYDLNESLAPQKVARTAWNSILYAAGARMVPQYIHEAFAWGAATGQWPDGTLYGERTEGVPDLDSEFHRHGPVWFAERGIRIDVPVLLRQGTSDNLFNLNQGLHILRRATTGRARAQSYLIAYNGGHALPNLLPTGFASGGDACSPQDDFTRLTIDFFKRAFAGSSTRGLLPARYNLTTAAGDECIRTAGFAQAASSIEGAVTTAGLGAPLNVEVARGPLTIAGIPRLTGRVTTRTLDARGFFGLSMGTSPADARVVQNNLMPLREARPVTDERFGIELPGVAANVPEGQRLFLTIAPESDMYAAHGSRVPGTLELSDMRLTIPGPTRDG